MFLDVFVLVLDAVFVLLSRNHNRTKEKYPPCVNSQSC